MYPLNISNSVYETLLTQSEQLMKSCLQNNEPALFHLSSGGSRTRLKLCVTSGIILEINPRDIVAASSCIELLHNASLVHDDLQDKDESRRGNVAAWKLYGKNAAICSGDMMINEAFHCLSTVQSSHELGELLKIVTKAVSDTIFGQTRDLSAPDTLEASDYEKIALDKSGPLFTLSLVLPLVLAGEKNSVKQAQQALNRLAVAYQIIDDIDDWEQDKKNGHLNIVNILAKQTSIDVALFTAASRAEYLLRKCIIELVDLPKQCAVPHKEMATRLLNTIKQLNIPKAGSK